MKKVVLCLLIPFLFQQCTDELREIDTVLSTQVEDNLRDQEFASHSGIPFNSYLGKYYKGENQPVLVSEKIENKISKRIKEQAHSYFLDKDISAEWIGDFEFDFGEYEFKVNSDRGIKVLIDDEIVIDDLDNLRQTSYKTFITLNGVHRILIFYNMDKSQIGNIIVEYYQSLHNAKNAKPLNDSKKSVKDFVTSINQVVGIDDADAPGISLEWEKISKE